MSNEVPDLTSQLPLKPGCTATLWVGAVRLYLPNKDCVAYEGLGPGEKPTPEWFIWRPEIKNELRLSDSLPRARSPQR